MIISLVITSILVTLSYGIYLKSSRLIQDDEAILTQLSDIISLEKDLLKLTEDSQNIRISENTIFFESKNNFASLAFTDSTLGLQENEGPDKTFNCSSWDVTYLNDQSNYIKSLEIVIPVSGFPNALHFNKSYSKSFLYNISSN